MNIFSRYLTLWVAIMIVLGVFLGTLFPGVVAFLDQFTYFQINILIVVLIWVMIYPMMLKIDFTKLHDVKNNPKGLVVTTVVNWVIKPFSMYLIAYYFFYTAFADVLSVEQSEQYVIGAVLLGAAPCTAMVFVWSHLVKGNATYTAVQVALNDLLLLVLFAPIVALLLGISNVPIPYETLLLSVLLFVVIPIALSTLTRKILKEKLDAFIHKFDGVPETGLMLTLMLIFMFQGQVILDHPFNILLISIPLILQTLFIFMIAYVWAKFWNVSYDVAGPAALIGASNFFELAVAIAIALFGLNSGATLATVVGVLVEVPLMLFLVGIVKRTKPYFQR